MYTRDEFQKEYHDYSTQVKKEAVEEANRINQRLTDGSVVVPVNLPPFGWGLMLRSAAEFLSAIGVEVGMLQEKEDEQ